MSGATGDCPARRRDPNRTAKAKLSLARLHKRIADQRQAVLHELSDDLTRRFDTVVIEDLNVSGIVKNRSLSRAISDAGFGALKHDLQYTAALRGCTILKANRFYPSSKTCSACGAINQELELKDRDWTCAECGAVHDRDLNAAINLREYGLHTLAAVPKRTQEDGKTGAQTPARLVTVGRRQIIPDSLDSIRLLRADLYTGVDKSCVADLEVSV